MTAFDYAVVGIVAASALVGLWRGVVSEILALVAWVVAFVAARQFGADTGALFATWIADGVWRTAAGMAAVFVGVLLSFGFARLVLAMLLRAVGLGLLDRMLGACFGVVRGAALVLVGVMVGGMTAWPKETWWQGAALAPPLETAVVAMKPWLPPEVAKRIRYR